MRVPLEAGDRTLLIVAGALLVGMTLAAALLTPRGGESQSVGYPSSFSAASDGGKAAYLLLDELGYEVERWTSLPDQLPDAAEGVVLVIADPFPGVTFEEKQQVEQFIRRGGRVLFAGPATTSLLPATGLTSTGKVSFGWEEFSARTPGPLSRFAPSISMKTMVRWGRSFPDYVPYYGDDQGAVVVKSKLGDGEIIWWADSSPLTNHGLTRSANLMLFLNSIGPPQDTRILWDEYFHGMRAGFWDYLGRTPVPWALAQVGLLFLVIVLTYSRRSGPVAAPRQESRLSPLEFVETVGDLYERKGAAAGAVEVVFNRFRFLLERRFGLSSPASIESLARAFRERGGPPDAELIGTLRKCEQAVKSGRVSGQQALALAQSLHDYTRRLRLGRIGG
jgi:hypothetical protein